MIRLIGPGGAGKSTIGALLAERLNVLKHLLGEYPALLSMSRITTPAVHTFRSGRRGREQPSIRVLLPAQP
jgi:ribose 1,5-bisphosphokinase PhnN